MVFPVIYLFISSPTSKDHASRNPTVEESGLNHKCWPIILTNNANLHIRCQSRNEAIEAHFASQESKPKCHRCYEPLVLECIESKCIAAFEVRVVSTYSVQ